MRPGKTKPAGIRRYGRKWEPQRCVWEVLGGAGGEPKANAMWHWQGAGSVAQTLGENSGLAQAAGWKHRSLNLGKPTGQLGLTGLAPDKWGGKSCTFQGIVACLVGWHFGERIFCRVCIPIKHPGGAPSARCQAQGRAAGRTSPPRPHRPASQTASAAWQPCDMGGGGRGRCVLGAHRAMSWHRTVRDGKKGPPNKRRI